MPRRVLACLLMGTLMVQDCLGAIAVTPLSGREAQLSQLLFDRQALEIPLDVALTTTQPTAVLLRRLFARPLEFAPILGMAALFIVSHIPSFAQDQPTRWPDPSNHRFSQAEIDSAPPEELASIIMHLDKIRNLAILDHNGVMSYRHMSVENNENIPANASDASKVLVQRLVTAKSSGAEGAAFEAIYEIFDDPQAVSLDKVPLDNTETNLSIHPVAFEIAESKFLMVDALLAIMETAKNFDEMQKAAQMLFTRLPSDGILPVVRQELQVFHQSLKKDVLGDLPLGAIEGILHLLMSGRSPDNDLWLNAWLRYHLAKTGSNIQPLGERGPRAVPWSNDDPRLPGLVYKLRMDTLLNPDADQNLEITIEPSPFVHTVKLEFELIAYPKSPVVRSVSLILSKNQTAPIGNRWRASDPTNDPDRSVLADFVKLYESSDEVSVRIPAPPLRKNGLVLLSLGPKRSLILETVYVYAKYDVDLKPDDGLHKDKVWLQVTDPNASKLSMKADTQSAPWYERDDIVSTVALFAAFVGSFIGALFGEWNGEKFAISLIGGCLAGVLAYVCFPTTFGQYAWSIAIGVFVVSTIFYKRIKGVITILYRWIKKALPFANTLPALVIVIIPISVALFFTTFLGAFWIAHKTYLWKEAKKLQRGIKFRNQFSDIFTNQWKMTEVGPSAGSRLVTFLESQPEKWRREALQILGADPLAANFLFRRLWEFGDNDAVRIVMQLTLDHAGRIVVSVLDALQKSGGPIYNVEALFQTAVGAHWLLRVLETADLAADPAYLRALLALLPNINRRLLLEHPLLARHLLKSAESLMADRDESLADRVNRQLTLRILIGVLEIRFLPTPQILPGLRHLLNLILDYHLNDPFLGGELRPEIESALTYLLLSKITGGIKSESEASRKAA